MSHWVLSALAGVIDSARYGTASPEASSVARGSKIAEPIMWPERSQRPDMGLKLSVSVSRPQTSLPPSTGVPASTPEAPSTGAAGSGVAVVSALVDPHAPASSATATRPEVNPASSRLDERWRMVVFMLFLRTEKGVVKG